MRRRIPCFLLLPALLFAGCRPPQPVAPARPSGLFRDVAREAGLRFRWGHGGKTPLTALETFGCGCAFLDANEDARLDILLVGEPRCGLFLQEASGSFRDATAESGLAGLAGQWKGVAVGDFNGDGHVDLILTGYRCIAALAGSGDGRFRDVTKPSGLRETGWGSSAGLCDLDQDGDLDLVLGHYVVFGPDVKQYCDVGNGVMSGCPPQTYAPEFARLYRNDDGRFTDISAASGMDATHGKNLVVGFADYDRDGRVDFWLGNDGTPADLMHNEGDLRFRNQAVALGVSSGVFGQAQAAMGVDWADYDGDGHLDMVCTAFEDEPYSLYRFRDGYFENVSLRTGLAEPTLEPLGFGVKFLDYDNDGWQDLVFANGHVYDRAGDRGKRMGYRQPLQLFRGDGKRFADVSGAGGASFSTPILGRGLATGDYDADGLVDILVVDYEGEPLLLRNRHSSPGHWLSVELSPTSRSVGAEVTVLSGDRRWVQPVTPASSYLSSSSHRVHFGLGERDEFDAVVVRWPGGVSVRRPGGPADRLMRIDYPSPGGTAGR